VNRIVRFFLRSFLFNWSFISHFLSVYDQYYASLAASSAAVSAQPTPTAQSALGSSDSGDFGYDEEEDRKPSVQYLDSLNAYRKRSRSHEDVGTAAKIKQLKIDATEGIYGIGNGLGVVINGYTPENGIEVEQDAVMVGDATLLLEDDPMVYGTPLPVYLFYSQSIRFEL
jgi:transcription initiation factor TFIIE subunit alpha